MMYRKEIIDYLLGYKSREYPIIISLETDNRIKNRKNNYGNFVHLLYDPKNDWYQAKNLNTNKNKLFRLIIDPFKREFQKGLIIQSKIDNLNIDIFQLGQNQVHIIDLNEKNIVHILLPDVDKEWFLNDIYIQKIIQNGNYSIKTPTISFVDSKTPFFITDYITGNGYDELTIKHQNEITVELFKYYVTQKDFVIKSLEKEYKKIEKNIHEYLKKLEPANTKILQAKIKSLYNIINNKANINDNKDIYYVNIAHGDLNYKENVIKNHNGEIYFIDWEMSRSANILYDYFYMMLFELNQVEEIEEAMLFNFFQSSDLDSLVEKIENVLFIAIKKQNVIDYFYLSIFDMVLYKLLIFDKKRIKPINISDVKNRINSLEKYLSKIIRALEKVIIDNEKYN